MKLTALGASCAILAGCSTGVVQTDKDTFMVGKSGGLFASPESTKAHTYQTATAFCSGRGRDVETVTVQSRGGIPFVRPAGAELLFRCVEKK